VRKAALALLLVLSATFATASADCRVHRGQRVVLYSTTDDPSVLVWDSRERLRDYHAASFDEAQAMLPHAVLVSPGTRAVVVSCISNYVQSPLFHTPDDAVGVVISTGPQHGLIRWVLGSDVRLLTR
jgi:hypothetical protein